MTTDLRERYHNSKFAEQIKKLSDKDGLEWFVFGFERMKQDREAGHLIPDGDAEAYIAYMEEVDEAYFLHKKLNISYDYKHLTDLKNGEQVKFNAPGAPGQNRGE